MGNADEEGEDQRQSRYEEESGRIIGLA